MKIKQLLSNFSINAMVLRWPKRLILFSYIFVNILITLPFYKIMPLLLSYAPGLRQNPSVYKMAYGYSFAMSYWSLVVIFVFVHVILLNFLIGNVNKWKKLLEQSHESTSATLRINTIRKRCIIIPFYVLFAEIVTPLVSIVAYFIYLKIIGYNNLPTNINVIKLLLLFISIYGSIGVVSFVFAKSICRIILLNTDTDGSVPGFRVSFRRSLTFQMLLMFIVGTMIIALAGYAKLIEEKGDLLVHIKKKTLTDVFDLTKKYRVDEIKKMLQMIQLSGSNECTFYLGENGDVYTSDNSKMYKDFETYLTYLSSQHNGRVHIASGEIQGASIKLQTDKGPYWVGIKYLVVSEKMAIYFIICFVVLFIFNSFIFYYFSYSISSDISIITSNLNKIAENNTVNLDKRIPVVSNDEIGDLVVAFNRVQKMTKKHIEYIKQSETIVREQERLASLGQLIGGIAHNLRTPIMAIAGGLEGLNKLIIEYDASIDNATVTKLDHHDIALEMKGWIEKLKPYCSYMSDIITTVKDQARLDYSQSSDEFSIGELIKRIKILNVSELRSKNRKILFHTHVDETFILQGNITILLQVINNCIINAIDSYGEIDGDIDITIVRKNQVTSFMIQDHGKGIPEEIQNKLFKQMITTKGKNGTGLGLYISFSRIVGSFQGGMTIDSQIGEGTTITIHIPDAEIRKTLPRVEQEWKLPVIE